MPLRKFSAGRHLRRLLGSHRSHEEHVEEHRAREEEHRAPEERAAAPRAAPAEEKAPRPLAPLFWYGDHPNHENR